MKLKLPEVTSVEYIGADKGQVRLQDGQLLKFKWAPTSVASTAVLAVYAYKEHCTQLLDKWLESSTPLAPQEPDYSKLESGEHYWVLRNRIIHEKPDPVWVVAKYNFADLYPWTCIGFVNPTPKSEILQIGERVPHPEDK